MIADAEDSRSSLTRHLHNEIIDMVYAGDVLQLTVALRNICKDVTYIDYIFVIDDDGHLLAHTFDTVFPSGLFNVNLLSADKTASSRLLLTSKGRVRDFAMRTAGHMQGEIHVGMNEEVFYKQINDSVKMTIIMTIVCLALGLFLVYAISGYLSKPLKNLSLGMKKIENGDLQYRLEEKGDYEVLNLLQGYNRMTESILDSNTRLQQAKDNLTNTLNSMEDGVYIVNQEHDIKFVNSALIKDFGPFEGKKCYKYFHDLDEVCPWCKNDDVVAGKTVRWEWYSTKNQKTYDLIDTPLILPDGSIGKLEMFRDITERKQTEEALRKERNFSQSIIDTAQAIILVLNPDGSIAEFNPYMEKLSGYSIEEVRGKDWFETFLPERYRQKTGELFTKAIADIKTEGNINPIVTGDGKELTIEWFNRTLKDKNGDITGILAIGQDITERRNIEEQLRQSQKMEAIGMLAGGVAHDFNNLLTVILGNAQLALMNVIKDESLRKEIKEIKKAGEKAASLTRQLLAFSRKQVVRPKLLDINELINEMEKMLKYMIGENIDFQTVLGPELWKVCADPGQINQIIMNMVINSRDAMLRGGGLTIETANTDLNENYFCEHGIKEVPGHYVMLAVSDTGSGMDKEIQEHIFEPFFTTKEVGQGTGLGLSTIYGIVKQNNGFVWVYSEPGKGTTFKVYLPEVKDAEPEEKEQTPVDDSGGSETVLIVEDDDKLRKFVQRALQMYGYRILDAENGEDALRVCGEYEGQIDLMITDVVMPKMGGREAAERLQHLYPQIKVIYMSGYTDNTIVHYGVLTPELNFIQKPFTPKGLARKVRETLVSNHYKLRQRNV
jgi:PAS domain S-box-containing protein